jgi:hypothetical protein
MELYSDNTECSGRKEAAKHYIFVSYQSPLGRVILVHPRAGAQESDREGALMIELILAVWAAVCALSTIALFALVLVSKVREDLD